MLDNFPLFVSHIAGVMVSVPALSKIDHGFEPRPGKKRTIKLVFAASPWLPQNQDNMYDCSDMSMSRLLFQ